MITRELAKTLMGLLDLTSLNDSDNEHVIRELCQQANNNVQPVAAICVKPEFVKQSAALGHDRHCGNAGDDIRRREQTIQIATVVNFPSGDEGIEDVLNDVRACLRDGANEIDVVFPYRAYLRGEKTQAVELIRAVKETCGDQALVKVILETGALPNLETIREVATAAMQAGADFLKTSTGKIAQGASPDAVRVMLEVIRDNGRHCGIKISGGVRTAEQAAEYYQLAQRIMGMNWPKKETFRIGASGLLKNLLMVYDSFPLLQK